MSFPALTICIPAYNRPDYLKDALTSLCDQGLNQEDFVVAISDDASAIPLDPAVSAFEGRLQMVYQRSQQNIGHIANFERAFNLARTPYVSLLPHDDVLAPGHLSRALPLLQSNPSVTVLAALVLHQSYPGAPGSYVHGFSLHDSTNEWQLGPYRWNRTEWMAAALVATPYNMVGAIYHAGAFRKCQRWKSFPLWHDRVWCAELGFHGDVVTLPWVGGYYRVSDEQMSRRLWETNAEEFREVSIMIMELCEASSIPVVEFWIDLICRANSKRRTTFLNLLHRALPGAEFGRIIKTCEHRLGTRLHLGGRLSEVGLPWQVVEFLRRTIRGL